MCDLFALTGQLHCGGPRLVEDLELVITVGNSWQDGFDCIWLVNEKGKYEQSTDRDGLVRCFQTERLSDERDYYSLHKRKLGPLSQRV